MLVFTAAVPFYTHTSTKDSNFPTSFSTLTIFYFLNGSNLNGYEGEPYSVFLFAFIR